MKKELHFSTRLTREDVAGIVEAAVEGMKEGLLKVQKSDDSLELSVPRVIDLDIDAAVDNEKAVFTMAVSWRVNREENPDAGDEGENSEAAPEGTSHSGRAGREAARDNLREAAQAARAAARHAGKVVKKTAHAATALFREGRDKVGAEDLARQVGDVFGAATRKAGKVVKTMVGHSSSEARPGDGQAREEGTGGPQGTSIDPSSQTQAIDPRPVLEDTAGPATAPRKVPDDPAAPGHRGEGGEPKLPATETLEASVPSEQAKPRKKTPAAAKKPTPDKTGPGDVTGKKTRTVSPKPGTAKKTPPRNKDS